MGRSDTILILGIMYHFKTRFTTVRRGGTRNVSEIDTSWCMTTSPGLAFQSLKFNLVVSCVIGWFF